MPEQYTYAHRTRPRRPDDRRGHHRAHRHLAQEHRTLNRMDFSITQQVYDEFMKNSIHWLHAELDSKPSGIAPKLAILARDADGEDKIMVVAIMGDFNESEVKYAAMRAIGHKIFEQEVFPMIITLLTEAWLSRNAYDMDCAPRYDPKKIEVVILSGRDLSGNHKSATYIPIKRDEENRIIRDGPDETMSGNDVAMALLDELYKGWIGAGLTKFGSKKQT